MLKVGALRPAEERVNGGGGIARSVGAEVAR